VTFEVLQERTRRGLRLTFEDQGPGIPDIDLAITDGYTTGDGLGLGLGGARRLVNEFEIRSVVGQGTKVTITRWK
jgi:serine/threonine-protein kinase RsbT